jgi:pimeloyl-ACP methyl ester carboxylesterase
MQIRQYSEFLKFYFARYFARRWCKFWLATMVFVPVNSMFGQHQAIQDPICPHRPVLMIHGMLGSGDNYQYLANYLLTWGYCAQHLHVYNWNTLGRNPNEVKRLDSVINAILQTEQAAQLDIVGHSAGGSLAYNYLSDSARSTRVARYVHIGSRPMPKPAGPSGAIPTLNIYSHGDLAVPGADIAGATNVAFSTYDHFGIVAADSTANEVFHFFYGSLPPPARAWSKSNTATQVQVLQMGDNTPESGATITWYQAPKTIEDATKIQQTVTNDLGKASLGSLLPQQPYMVVCKPREGRAVAYYFPEVTNGALPLYLRTLPNTGMVRMLLQGIPQRTGEAAFVLFGSSGAFLPGGPPLVLNGDTLNTKAITPAAKTVVALFLYDNGDGQTSRQTQGAFAAAPFMNAIDYYLPTSQRPFVLQWKGKAYEIPAIPSSKAVTVVVLP